MLHQRGLGQEDEDGLREKEKEEREKINETFQDRFYELMQNLLDDVEMQKMEYQLTLQYLSTTRST
eukprot:782430-Amphidinium_carterae.1